MSEDAVGQHAAANSYLVFTW